MFRESEVQSGGEYWEVMRVWTIIIGRMESSAISNLQMMSEQTHYLKDWEVGGEEGMTHQGNTRSCSFIFHHRHSENSKYARKASDFYGKKGLGCKRTTKSVIKIDEHSFPERNRTKKFVSDNNSLPALPKKTNANKLLAFIFRRQPEEKQTPPQTETQTYNTVNLYDILRENPEQPPPPEKSQQTTFCRKKTNPKLRFDYELIKRKKFAMNIRYLRERNNQYDIKAIENLSRQRERSKSKCLREGYSHNGRNIFVNCSLLPKFGSKYSLEII